MSDGIDNRQIAIFGAGKIGRGVVGLLFSRAGYHLHLYDTYMDGMRQLKGQGHYDVRVTDGRAADTTERVAAFDIVDSETPEPMVALLQRVDTVACCVYEGAFASIAQVIAAALRHRLASGCDRALNVLLCVNALGAPARVTEHIGAGLSDSERAHVREHVGVCQVMVLAAGVPSEPGSNPWEVVVSADPRLEIDADAWQGPPLDVRGVRFVQGSQGLLYRKVYCGNMRHAMAGFMGKATGYEFICECHRDPWIRASIVGAFQEAHAAIAREFDYDPAEDAAWVAFINDKLDAGVKDPIDRVIAQPGEKLSRGNRFVGPALMCLAHHIVPFYLARGIAHGLDCLAAERNVKLASGDDARAFAIRACGLTEEDWVLLDLIVKQHADIAGGSRWRQKEKQGE